MLKVFLDELDVLRADELQHRQSAAQDAITEYAQAVEDLRHTIANVQQSSGLVSFDHFKDIVAERDDLAGRVQEARIAKNAAHASMTALARQLGTTPEHAALNLRLLSDPEIQNLARTLAEQTAELAEAEGRFGSRHPVVTSAWHAVSGTEARLAARGQTIGGRNLRLASARFDFAPDTERTSLMSDLVALAAECESKAAALASIEAQFKELDARVVQLAPQAARLDDLSRDYQIAEAVFASALARTDTSKVEVYASYPLVQVLADASLPDRASSPRGKIAIAAGIVATIMVLVALTLAWLRQPLINTLLRKTEA